MWYIIIGIIVLGLLGSFFSWLSDLVGGAKRLFTIIVILLVTFLAFSWVGVLAVIGIGVGGCIIVGLLCRAGEFIGETVEEHDKQVKETAKIKQETETAKQVHENDNALIEELNKNCFWLGCMDVEAWKKKLPNYVDRLYSSSFEKITMNFARQIEQQHIIQNDDWFEPYKLYVLKHPGGSTVTKMLNEVNCPQLKMTHITPDGDLINTWLVRGTKRVSKDVPELFRMTFIKDINENVFTPTEYLKKLYLEIDETSTESHVEEIDFNDL